MMFLEVLLVVARVCLAGVFAVAGTTKLLDISGTRRALIEFGLPAAWAPACSILLPIAELLVAVALLTGATALYGAAGALGLLVVFITAIAANLYRGRAPGCACFGQVRSRPVSMRTLVRNIILATLAAISVAGEWAAPGPSLLTLPLPLTSAFGTSALVGVLVVLLGAQTMFLFRVLRQNEKLVRAAAANQAHAVNQNSVAAYLSGLPVGSPAPGFVAANVAGEEVALESLLADGKPLVLLFADPACAACRALLPDIALWQHTFPDAMRIVVVSRGSADENRMKFSDLESRDVLVQRASEVSEAFRALGTPSAVLVQPDGTIGAQMALAEAEIRSLVIRLTRPQIGSSVSAALAHEFVLPDLLGNEVSLRQFRPKPTLVLFWAADCGLCDGMLQDVRQWEAEAHRGRRLQLVIVTDATLERRRGFRLASPIVFDEGSAVRTQYGGMGTPAAALVDGAGFLVKQVSGRAAILRLAGWPARAPSERTRDVRALRPRRAGSVEDELLADGSMVLFNAADRQVITLNPTGALVWECCDGEHRIADIVSELSEVYPDVQTAEHDVRAVIEGLEAIGMVVHAPDANADQASALAT